jgi:hypothetical protein
MKRLDVRVTERARALIDDFLSAYEPDTVIALNYGEFKTYTIQGVETNEMVARWRFVALARSQADEIEKLSEVLGTQGLYDADGITICLFEPSDVERLRGKTLDAERGRLLVR